MNMLSTIANQLSPLSFVTNNPAAADSSFYDITETAASGETVSFAQFKGKVVYGVNVASA